MIGRRIVDGSRAGIITQWEPLGAALTDVLVKFDDGSLCWFASHTLKPSDGAGPLPSRREARERADRQLLSSLERIRQQHVDDWSRRWPGVEFGKAILGRSLDAAIQDVASRLTPPLTEPSAERRVEAQDASTVNAQARRVSPTPPLPPRSSTR